MRNLRHIVQRNTSSAGGANVFKECGSTPVSFVDPAEHYHISKYSSKRLHLGPWIRERDASGDASVKVVI